jgi:CRISPR-associated protein Csm5
MRGDVIWRCVAWAVTPVHIGSGEDWVKSDYTIRDGRLCRFDPASVLLRMDPVRRREFERAVDRGDLQGADRIVKNAVGELDIIETIPLGPTSRDELGKAQTDPRRWGEVKPFVRTNGRPFVPGSSIKGAIRTALLNAAVQEKGVAQAKRILVEAGPRAPDGLQQWAFAYDGRHTEQDPFRFLQVSDAVLPQGATRIDRVVNWSPKGGDSEKIQMHVERLVARCDGQGAPRFSFEIRIDAGRLREARRRDGDRVPRFDLDPGALTRAVNAFHRGRLTAERDRFFSDTARYLDSLFRVALPGGGEVGIDGLAGREDFLLLRVGRFGQFESKSVDGLRRGWNPQARKWMEEGGTRNVVPLRFAARDGGIVERRFPLGWVLVWLREVTHG